MLDVDGHTLEIAVSGPLIVNDFPTISGAAFEGMGLAQSTEPVVAVSFPAAKLVPVLGHFAPTTPGVFLYYSGHRQMQPKLRAFIDHVQERMAKRKERTRRGPRARSRS